MSARPSDEPFLRRRSAVLLVIGVAAFGVLDPPVERAAAPPEGTTLTRRYHPPAVTKGGVQLGPSTRITKLP